MIGLRATTIVSNTIAIGSTARQFVYDDRNRMVQVKQGGVVTRNYAYNGKGERVRHWLGVDDSLSVYNESGQWLGDYDASGLPKQQVVWMDDMPVGVLADGSLHYIEPDHLGTPRLVVDAVRDVPIWRWDASGEVFGNTVPNQDPDGDAVDFVFDMRFPGQRYDAASGFNYNYFRDYEPGIGRYVQSDPIGLEGGISTYAYVGGSPIMAIDSLGLETCLLTTVTSTGIRDHAAVYTSRGDGGGPALYDPAGSYGASNGGGSSGLVTGEAADIKKFIGHHDLPPIAVPPVTGKALG